MSQFATQISDDVSELFTFHNRNIGAFHFPCPVKYLLDSTLAKNKTKQNTVSAHAYVLFFFFFGVCFKFAL